MNVTYHHHGTCLLCRCRIPGIRSSVVRVNKHTLRETAPAVMFTAPTCPECRTYATPGGRWALDADSQARVDTARAERGWVA